MFDIFNANDDSGLTTSMNDSLAQATNTKSTDIFGIDHEYNLGEYFFDSSYLGNTNVQNIEKSSDSNQSENTTPESNTKSKDELATEIFNDLKSIFSGPKGEKIAEEIVGQTMLDAIIPAKQIENLRQNPEAGILSAGISAISSFMPGNIIGTLSEFIKDTTGQNGAQNRANTIENLAEAITVTSVEDILPGITHQRLEEIKAENIDEGVGELNEDLDNDDGDAQLIEEELE